MTITDQRSTTAAPTPPPPSYVRRHPILTGFGVLSGLSLFSALWPVSAIVVAIAVGGHATGLDRAAWRVTRLAAAHVVASVRGHESAKQRAPVPPQPAAPAGPAAPHPAAPPAPSRDVHPPTAATPHARRRPSLQQPVAAHPRRPRRQRTPEDRVGSGMDGRGHSL